VPSALKSAEEYGDDVTVLFVEVQGATPAAMQKFAWQRGWMGTPAMWTTERPFNTGSRGIPNFALLSSSGELLLKGNPMALHSKIEELIAEDLKQRGELPEGAPDSLKKAYKEFGKGDLADALEEAREVAAEGEEGAAAAEEFAKEIEAAIDARFERLSRMLAAGYVLEAEDHFDDLEKAIKGLDSYEQRLEEAEAAVDEADDRAAKKLAKLEASLMDEIDERGLKKLADFIEDTEGPVGERAKALLDLLQG